MLIEKFVPLKLISEELTCTVSSVTLTVTLNKPLTFVLFLDGASHLLSVGAWLSFFAPGVKVERLNILKLPSGYLPTEMFSPGLVYFKIESTRFPEALYKNMLSSPSFRLRDGTAIPYYVITTPLRLCVRLNTSSFLTKTIKPFALIVKSPRVKFLEAASSEILKFDKLTDEVPLLNNSIHS